MSMESSAEVTYTVVVHHEEGSYWAEVKELPGCFAAGDTQEELDQSLAEAVGLYLSEDGSPIHANVTGKTELTTERSESVKMELVTA